jgi:hypothetical protein
MPTLQHRSSGDAAREIIALVAASLRDRVGVSA